MQTGKASGHHEKETEGRFRPKDGEQPDVYRFDGNLLAGSALDDRVVGDGDHALDFAYDDTI